MKTGVLLVNLGSPQVLTVKAIRKYLSQFLHDKRVIEIPRVIWCLILHGIILRIRPRKILKAYSRIWLDEGSPLLHYSQQQLVALQQAYKESENVHFALAMRYGEPSIASALKTLQSKNIDKLIVLPLYPQYAAATVGSVFDAVMREIKQWRYIPALHMMSGYAQQEDYINALAHSVKQYWHQHGRGEKLLISFHGLPARSIALGDPYNEQCKMTARLLVKALGLSSNDYQMVFQSRFGRAKWLQPYFSDAIQTLAEQGVKRVDVICPGFAADCLETLDEIVYSYNQLFLDAGGESLNYIPALNAQNEHITVLKELINPYLETIY